MASTATKWTAGASVPLIILLLVMIYAIAIEPRFLLDVVEEPAPIPNLPPSWEGKRVAVLADFQTGMWWDNEGMVERSIERAIAEKPAAILLVGDYVYTPDRAIVDRVVSMMKPLGASGIPTYAVLGNHDYSMMKEDSEINYEIADYLVERLEASGITVLKNESRGLTLGQSDEPLHIVGVGSTWAKNAKIDQALSGVPEGAPRVILMHNPATFGQFPPRAAPLVLSGHTHGGQIRLPILDSTSWLDIAKPREVIADGWADVERGGEGNRAYVSRGTGFSTIPARLFCRPELVFFELREGPTGTKVGHQ